jgi:hypothetical protein
MVGPTFDPFAAATMSDEMSKAAQSDARQAAEHANEDRKAAEKRAARGGRRRRGLTDRIRGLFRRG